jgi:hypothetical protein
MKRFFLFLFAALSFSVSLKAQSTITFKVNMQNQTVSPNGVHIAGSFQTPQWQPGATAMTDADGDGIYEYTQVVPTGVGIQFKFINGNNWGPGQDEAVPQSCGVANGVGGYNRQITPTAPTVEYGPVCFAACENCAAPPTANVTFAVNMSNEAVSPNGVNVAIVPQFGALISAPMTDADADGVYTATVELDTNQNVYYRFQNGIGAADVESVPSVCATNFMGMPYRFLDFGSADVTLDAVCFGECENCIVIVNPTIDVTLQVNMSEQVVSADGVHVAGNFQGWDAMATPMTDADGDGVYSVTVTVDENANLLYKFINGNAFSGVEDVPGVCGLPDGFGANNRVLETGTIDITVPAVCFGACSDCFVAPVFADVTFLVNMENENVSAEGIYYVGELQGWVVGDTPMLDSDGDGIYEVTLSAEVGSEVQFRFLNGNDWPFSETVPTECGVDDGFGGMNRSFLVGEIENVYGPICFGGCIDCEPIVEPTTVNVTFQVNMANETVSADGVFIAGSFQGWTPGSTQMTDTDGDGIYTYTAAIETNTEIAYKFLNGNTWGAPEELVPSDCGVDNGFGGYNRGLTVGEADTLLEVVCYGECIDCLPQTLVIVTLQVDMSNQSVTNDEVYVAGSFNGWNATESLMIPLGNGVYQLPIAVNSGEDVTYKFINGTTWESVPADCGLSDGFGGFNRAFTAPANNTEFQPICFNECAACIVVPTLMLTLTVEMTEVTISPMGVYVAGTFNNFSPTATMMEEVEPALYRVTVEVGQNEQVFFKFLNGNDFAGTETVPFECGVDDGFGGYNRSVTTNTSDVTMPTVCFSSCAPCFMGVGSLETSAPQVYPNPAREVVRVMSTQPLGTLTVIDSQGKVVYTAMNASNSHLIETQNWSSGIYHVLTEGADAVRFIKE